MQHATISIRLGFALAIALFASSAGAGTIYEFTILDVPGASSTTASGINESGQIVGSYTDSSGSHGFVLDGSTYTAIDYAGATSSSAGGINDVGQIVGTYTDSGGTHGFLLDGGTYQSFDVPPEEVFNIHFDTWGYDINDAAQIVGSTTFMSDTLGSYLTSGIGGSQGWSVFFADSFTTSLARGINDAGDIVGSINFGFPGTQGYLLVGGSASFFSVPDAGEFGDTIAAGINDAGQIVGSFHSGDFSSPHGFLKEGDSYMQLDVPDAAATSAFDINDAGWIVGSFRDASGTTHGFLATPIPEPTTLVLVGGGLCVLLASRGRRWGDRARPPIDERA